MKELNRYLAAHLYSSNLEQAIIEELSEDDIVRRLIRENEPLTEIVGSGADGYVYKINNNYAVKVLSWNYEGRGVDYEYDVAQELYRFGVSVPKPIGVFDVKTKTSGKTRNEKGFVMEFVHGTKSSDSNKKNLELELEYKKEIKKCKKAGFVPKDTEWNEWAGHNVLYDEKQDKIYLVDLIRWRKKLWKRIFLG